MGLDPGVFGRFDLAALVQPHLKFLFVCLFVYRPPAWACEWNSQNRNRLYRRDSHSHCQSKQQQSVLNSRYTNMSALPHTLEAGLDNKQTNKQKSKVWLHQGS